MMNRFLADLKKKLTGGMINRYSVTGAILAVLVLLTVLSSFDVRKAVSVDEKGATNSFVMPHYVDFAPSKNYRISLEVNRGTFFQDNLHFIPDDRVDMIRINGTNVDLSVVPAGRLQDWVNGFRLDLGRYFRPGLNTMEISVTNFGGTSAVAVYSTWAEKFTLYAFFVLICLLLFVFLGKELAFNREKIEITLAVLVAAFIAFSIRYYLLLYQSGDYGSYLAWFLEIKRNGFRAFGYEFSNYAPAYLYLLGLTTWLPVINVIAIKTIPILFDFVTAVFIYKTVKAFYPENRLAALMSGLVFLFMPTAWLNSGAWGQCDSLFTSFIVMSLYCLVREKPLPSLIFYSIAFSLKVQAVFIAPVYLVFFLLRSVKFRHFFLIPGVYLLFAIPSMLAGRSLIDILMIYAKQSSTFTQLTLNAATFYQWVGNHVYFLNAGIFLTLGIVLILSYLFWKGMKDRLIKKEKIIEIGLLFALVVPFFLPAMHERYFYPADVISVLYAFVRPRRFYVAIVVVLCSMFSYGPFLFGMNFFPMQFVSLGVAFAIAVVMADLVRDLFFHKRTAGYR